MKKITRALLCVAIFALGFWAGIRCASRHGRSLPEGEGQKKAEVKILWDFEKPGQLSEWMLEDEMEAALASEHTTSGKNSVRLDWQKGGGPSFKSEGQIEDLSTWRSIEFDAFNPGEKPVEILVKLKSSEHQKQTTLSFNIAPKEERTVSANLDSLSSKIDLSDVMYFNIFVWEPAEPGTVFIDTIRLKNE